MAADEDEVPDLGQERAEVLYDGIPYVRGWATAHGAADELAGELRALGFEEDFAYLRADVDVRGQGFVNLDVITTEAAQRLARLLTLGLCTELERLAPADIPGDRAPRVS
ncbi:hypothetical protein [Phaeacidiphilus oryzae]|uniref:hypothetical protein n=1 Tax=Phaeacidiphilus oryzae TaxID=348818 RepID=UPI00068EC80F|nr:hypothetical protein [Phaeacidiphilus oryzae]